MTTPPPYAPAAAEAAPATTVNPLEFMDPLDVLELDSLFYGERNSSTERDASHWCATTSLTTDKYQHYNLQQRQEGLSQHQEEGLGAQDEIAAFLAEMDAFEEDLLTPLPIGGSDTASPDCTTSFDLYPARSSSGSGGGIDFADLSFGALSTRPPIPVPDSPVAIPVVKFEVASDEAIALQFALFARAFAMEPPRPVKSQRRIRPKEQIEILQETAASLERDLEALQPCVVGQKRKQSALVSRDHGLEDAPSTKPTTFAIQSLGGVGLETNRQLRKTVDAQLKHFKKIGKKLIKQASDLEVSSWVASESLGTQLSLTNADFLVVYEALAGKLDAIYTQLNEVFAAKSLSNAKVAHRDARVIVDKAERLATLQFQDEKILPFSFQAVCDACWRDFEVDALDRDHPLSALLPKDDDVFLVKKALAVQMDDNQEEVAIPVRFVSKRFLSKNRMAFCWEGTAEWPSNQPAAATSNAESCVPMRDRGWGLIQPMPGSGGGDSGLCHVQICVYMEPRFSDERVADEATQVEQLQQLVIPRHLKLLTARSQMIENFLLDNNL